LLVRKDDDDDDDEMKDSATGNRDIMKTDHLR